MSNNPQKNADGSFSDQFGRQYYTVDGNKAGWPQPVKDHQGNTLWYEPSSNTLN